MRIEEALEMLDTCTPSEDAWRDSYDAWKTTEPADPYDQPDTCPHCQDGGAYECTACAGNGQVQRGTSWEAECPVCDGQGWIDCECGG